MELSTEEIKQINIWKGKEIAKIEALNLPDDKKKDRLDLLESTEFHKVKPLRVREIAPHQWEAY